MTHRHNLYKLYATNRLRKKLARKKVFKDPEEILEFIEDNITDIMKARIDKVRISIDDKVESGLGDIKFNGNVHIGTGKDNELLINFRNQNDHIKKGDKNGKNNNSKGSK